MEGLLLLVIPSAGVAGGAVANTVSTCSSVIQFMRTHMCCLELQWELHCSRGQKNLARLGASFVATGLTLINLWLQSIAICACQSHDQALHNCGLL